MLALHLYRRAALNDLTLLFVSEFRDWVIIIMGVAVAAFFAVGLVMMLVLGLLTRSLLKKTSGLIDDGVKPLLESAKETASSVKGTASYVSEAAVQPIVRTYGVVAGVRRAAPRLRHGNGTHGRLLQRPDQERDAGSGTAVLGADLDSHAIVRGAHGFRCAH